MAREANVLKSLFNTSPEKFSEKVVVVLLPGAADGDVPDEIEPNVMRFIIRAIDRASLEGLLRRTHRSAGVRSSPLGEVPILAPESRRQRPTPVPRAD